MIKTAKFSDCGKYRYSLHRVWDESKKIVMCIGLNPSTANAEKNDATINILIRTLGNMNYGGFVMTNLYAYCTKSPDILLSQPDKQKDNDKWLQVIANQCDEVIYCWGGYDFVSVRVKELRSMIPHGLCFAKNKDGSPMHPMSIMWQGLEITELKKYA